MIWRCATYEFDTRMPIVMGILNVTPDSFSDGGQHDGFDAALAHAERMAEEGARIGREGIDGTLWERLKKGVYGNKVRSLNSFENLCVGQAQAFFAGTDFLRFADLFGSITKQEAEELIARWVTEERTALSVIRPKGGAD